ncbi:MAG: hypothetical protein ACRD3C_04615 [Vicinamibacterales bacterium]
MTRRLSGFLRDNAFIVAAVALPVAVAAFFVIATVIPRWTVPAPAYDLVLRANRPYDATRTAVMVEFTVRDGRVEATVRAPTPPNVFVEPRALLLFDHETMSVREIPVELPTRMAEGEPPRTIVVEALSDRRVSPQVAAPDGYALQVRRGGNPGLVGDLFGMGSYQQTAVLVKGGRVVEIDLPAPYRDPYQSPVYHIGWVLEEGGR